MNVWLLTVGEPLPIDSLGDRPWRAGFLAELLTDRGHSVTWWTSSFDHMAKCQRVSDDSTVAVGSQLRIRLLWAISYRKNISFRRLMNHYQLGKKFKYLAATEPPPDIILCSFPTIEMTRQAVVYGVPRKVPVVVDVRDLWPDIFLDHVPASLRGIARLALKPLFRQTEASLRESTALTAVSDGYLDWALRYAGRPRASYDRVFPLAYERVDSCDVERIQTLIVDNGLDTSKLICWFVGSFGRTYDLGIVIDGARALLELSLIHI